MGEQETVAVILRDRTVIIPLADAVAEYFRLHAITERSLSEEENAVHIALTLTLGTLPIGEGAKKLYAAGD